MTQLDAEEESTTYQAKIHETEKIKNVETEETDQEEDQLEVNKTICPVLVQYFDLPHKHWEVAGNALNEFCVPENKSEDEVLLCWSSRQSHTL